MTFYRTTIAIVACIFIAFSAVAAPFVSRSGCFLGCGANNVFYPILNPADPSAPPGERFASNENGEPPEGRWGQDPSELSRPDVVDTPNGTPEFVVSVELRESVSVVTALTRAGARLLRDQTLVHLEQRLLVFDLPAGLEPAAPSAISLKTKARMFGFLLDLFKPQAPRAPAITSEASMSFERGDIDPFLIGLTNNPRFGLPAEFTASIVEALPDLPAEASRRWKVDGSFDGQAMHLEIEVVMDDPDAPDLLFYSSATVIEEIDRELSDFAEAKEN